MSKQPDIIDQVICGDSAEVLDVCCGSRMFWFNRADERVIFCDKRVERHMLKDKTVPGGQRELIISPNIQADFTALPFPSNYFQVVVFDPPHFDRSGQKSWLRAKYGALEGDWRSMLAGGFSECFRVLAPGGTLIFKWSSVQIPLSEILKLTTERPLFGHRSGKASLTHWIAFLKPAYQSQHKWKMIDPPAEWRCEKCGAKDYEYVPDMGATCPRLLATNPALFA